MKRWLTVLLLGLSLPLSIHADPIDYDRLDQRAAALSENADIVGLAIAVVEDGEVTFTKGYGVTHFGGAPVTEDTVFRWASLSKGVAGTLVSLLEHDGSLALKDTATKFKTSLKLPGGGETRATLIDILSHRLGIVSNAYDGRLEDGRAPAGIRKALGGLKNVCALGTCHTYQNIAFDTVSEVVADVTGKPYSKVAAERIFAPLGMTSASLTRQELQASGNYARPYRRRAGLPMPASLNDSYYRVPAAGGVNTSIKDLAIYMQAQMGRRPDVLPQSVLDTIQLPRIKTLRETRSLQRRYGRVTKSDYGLGWRIYDYAGHKVVGHRGAVRGYRALILFDPDRDTGIAALWNSSSRRPVGLQFELMDMVYGLPTQDWVGLDGAKTKGNP